jgi:predicted RNase H-like HicB family nuclease/predicted XRE-type DNA-binding protein
MKNRYTVRFERDADSGWWVVTVPEIQGCLTQGRSIAEGRRRIREAMALFIDESEAERATLIDDVRLPPGVRRQVRQVAAVRERAERLRTQAQDVTRAAVSDLTRRAGLSVRDAAEMLGISFQRVQQLAGGGQPKGGG